MGEVGALPGAVLGYLPAGTGKDSVWGQENIFPSLQAEGLI